ncbi:hypothetical protein AAFC00_003598 [Neodothiora populina]|uniref:Uncharacterized protein n=1 Tax=Neodothiora populina TaxID=2781224 RepID=A0ABR3PET1_9PEZI
MPIDPAKAKERALTLQEREMHRYYQPWLDAHGSSNKLSRQVNDLGHIDNFSLDKLSSMGYHARQSRDRALTAFAQLAALRLGVRRAMVSLLDSTHQYILAEATRTISLVDDNRHDEHDELWLGSTIVPKADAICECTLRRTYTVKDDKGNPYTAKAAVIPDLSLDPEYADRPYVNTKPGLRFYAGVPIRTRSGHVIGVYAVSDDNPRHSITYDELRFMQDIALSIMDHMEWARDRVDRYKGERIVRGMADFIEGSPSMRTLQEEKAADARKESIAQSQASAEGSKERDGGKSRIPGLSPRLSPQGSHITNIKETLSPDSARASSPSTRPRAPLPKREKGSSLTRMLDRAARILRESTLAEGVVFFGPNGNNTNAKSSLRAATSGRVRLSEAGGTATDDDRRASSNETAEGDPSTDSDGSSQLRSKVLGISLTNERDAPLFHNTALAVPTLENYFKLYPHGKSFHFSEAGSGLSSEDDSASESQKEKRSGDECEQNETDVDTDKVLKRKQKIRMTHTELLKNLPGVRNVIFLPLWDYMDDKMVAGAFLWTSATGKMMTLDDDLSYLRAFGNTIMSEVARLTALKDDRAKTTFIASMSHELRSPLHGILGSVEFLQDTAADSYQMGLINSISTCGKTLLETLDHVLDYSKINKIGRSKMRKNARSNKVTKAPVDSPMESLNITAEIDLGIVVEEVVEAVCAGHAFKMMHTGELGSNYTSHTFSRSSSVSTANSSMDTFNVRDGTVSVLLDISPRMSWRVRTQPGALRRIIMNLLGNALKYTPSGFVAVSLRARESATPNMIDATFRVVDSGKGMSEDFQKNRLFVPFSQEDTFQPGTGLGLSIVRQIVDSLGGTIDLKSVQDVGTEIDVSLSLPAAEISAPVGILNDEISSVAEKTRGLRLCLLDPNSQKEKAAYDHIARLDTTLREVCYGWFEMDIVKASSMQGVDADVFMYTEPPSVEYLLEHHSVRRNAKDGGNGKEVPLIIVCLNASEAISITANHSRRLTELGRIVEVIPQPCGPRKMAKVLSHCMRRVEEAFGHTMQEVSTSSLSPHRMNVVPTHPAYSKPCLPPRSESEDRRETDRTSQYLSEIASEVPRSTAISFPDEKPNLDSEQVGEFTDIRAEQMMAAKQASLISLPVNINGAKGGPQPMPTKPSIVPHVLLVDDNRINLQLLVMFMKKHKFTYAEASNGQEALDAYIASHDPEARERGGRPFDFVLMDISMPVMNGMEATRRIREFEAEKELPRATVIALTGLASKSAQQEAESSGIDIYMPKPVKFQELRPLLNRKDSAAEI